MPYAGFAPMIASGFDALAAQQAGWAGFNAQQDAANIARLNAQQEQANRYWQNLAAMQQQEVARQDRIALAAQEEQRRQAETAAAMANRRREFDVNTQLAKEQLALTGKHYQFAQDERLRQEAQLATELVNAGQTLTPQYNRASRAVETAQQKWNEAQAHINSIGHEALGKELAGIANIRYNDKTMAFEPTMKGMSLTTLPLPDQQKISAAQAAVDAAKSDKQQVAIEFQNASNELKTLHDLAVRDYKFIPRKNKDGSWSLVSAHPKVNRAFDDVGEQAAGATPTAAAEPSFATPFWARPPSVDELNLTTPTGGGWAAPSTVTGPAQTFDFSGLQNPQPVPAAAPVAPPAAPAAQGAPYDFVPQRSSWLNNPMELARGYGRAANYWLGPLEPGQTTRTLSGTVDRMVGNPNAWLPPVPSGRVRVISPEGRTGTIPQDQVPAALNSGFKLA